MTTTNINTFTINSKEKTLNQLINHFKQYESTHIKYYLNNNSNDNIINFLETNIYDPDDIEFIDLIRTHLSIGQFKVPINISIITSLIYWEDVFVIENTIFITYEYLKRIFELIEYNEYTDTNSVYIYKDKIYDLDFLKKLNNCMIYINQYTILDNWLKIMREKFNCKLVDNSDIEFDKEYDLYTNFNTSFLNNSTIIYERDDKFYALLNIIECSSSYSYAPYYVDIIVELSCENNKYKIISTQIENKYNFSENLFDEIANKITNQLYLV